MNQKKIKILLLPLCLAVTLLFFVSQAYAEVSEDGDIGSETIVASGKTANADWSLDTNGVLTISGDGVIMNNYNQNTTYAPWREYSKQVVKIVVQAGVTSIGDYCFYDCTNATEIEIGNTVRTIGKYVIKGSFTSIYIPASVTDINQYAFYSSQGYLNQYIVSSENKYYSSDERGVLFDKQKTKLLYAPDCLEGSYTVPESVIEICAGFRVCRKLTSLTITDNVTIIDSSALSGCSNLQSLDIGDGVIGLGNLFSNSVGLTTLETISIGKGFTSTGNDFTRLEALKEINVCQENKNLTSVNGIVYDKAMTQVYACPRGIEGSFQIPDGITQIGNNAFYGSRLTEIILSDSIVKIGAGSFRECTNLEKFIMPDAVEDIAMLCFAGCVSLKEITTSKSLRNIEQSAFSGCSSLIEIYFPSGLYSIDRFAFEECSQLSKITFEGGYPASIDNTAFEKVTAVCYYPGNNLTWTDQVKTNYGGSLTWIPYAVDQFEGQEHTFNVPESNVTLAYKTDEEKMTASIVLCNLDAVGELEIPEMIDGYTVVDIADSAFKDCVGLTGIVIPDTVKSINNSAFNGCKGMTSVILPKGITVIPEYAFYSCGITSITIPGSVVEIAAYAFSKTKLAEVNIPEGVTIVGTSAFEGSSLKKAVLPNSLTYIPDRMFQTCYYLLDVDFQETLVSIGNSSFEQCLGLNSIVLPEGLVSIGDRAFCGCGDYVDYQGYYDCNNFVSVTLPKTLKSIGSSAFFWCTSLKTINIPDKLTRIENSTFSQCRSLTNISIPSNVTYIGSSAFWQCKSLKEITFKWSAPSIANNVFSSDVNCTGYYPSNNEDWTPDMLQNYGANTLNWVALEMEAPEGGSSGGSGGEEGETGSGTGGEGTGSGEGESGSGSGTGEGETGSGEGESGSGSGTGEGGSGSGTGEGSGSGTGEESIGDSITVNIFGMLETEVTVNAPDGGWKKGVNTFTVSGEKPCVVAASYDGGTTYVRLNATETENSHSYVIENMTADTILGVILAGDTNSDGTITNADASRLGAAFHGKISLNSMQFLAADLNKDETITNADKTKLLSIVLNKTTADW